MGRTRTGQVWLASLRGARVVSREPPHFHQEDAMDDAEYSRSIDDDLVRLDKTRPGFDDVVDGLLAILARQDRFNRLTLKRRLCPWMHDADFGKAFTKAVDRARDELLRVFAPQQHIETGLYVLADAQQRFNRGCRQIDAANRKMIRGTRTLAIPGDPADVELERRRTGHLERASFQMARRVIVEAEPLPNVVASRERPARPPIVQDTSAYPTVPPRPRY